MRFLALCPKSGAPVLQSERILLRVAGGAETASSSVSYKWQWGSASELENHLLLARDLQFLDKEKHSAIENKVIETKKMLATLIRKIDIDRYS